MKLLCSLILFMPVLALGQGTVLTTTDFESGSFPTGWSVVAGAHGGPCTIITAAADGIAAHGGTKVMKCATSGMGSPNQATAVEALVPYGSVATNCSGTGRYNGVGGANDCNPAYNQYLYQSWWMYVPAASRNALQLWDSIINQQEKILLNRTNAGASTGSWFMTGFGPQFGTWPNFVIEEDSGLNSPGQTTCNTIPADTWFHLETSFRRNSTTHSGHGRIWKDGILCWDVDYSGMGSDDSAQQLHWEFGIAYVQSPSADITNYIDDTCASKAAAEADAISACSGAAPGVVTAVMTAPNAGTPILSGSTTVSGTCTPTSPATCTAMQFKRCDAAGANCVNLGTSQAGAGPYSISWDTNTFNLANFPANTLDGNYTVYGTATDSNATTGDATKVSVTIQNAITSRPAVKH